MASGLTDMEELLERIDGGQIKGFMREALVCYGAGAHRACIVMSFIAVFEDLREKVKVAGSLNADAKTISAEIEALAAGQKPFESDLVNRLTSKKLLSALQGKRLTQMIDYRNKAAHPSGHYASAEEARFVYFEAIDGYLSKPLLQAADYAKGILERLKSGNYFPDSTMENIGNAVGDELSHLNPAAYPFLVAQLVTGIVDSDATFSANCRMFLTGLAGKQDPELRPLLAKQFVKAKAIDPDYAQAIATSISADPLVLRGAGAITRVRVNAMLVKLVEEADGTTPVTRLRHPVHILKTMVQTLDDAEIAPDYTPFVRATAEKFWSNAELTRSLKTPGAVSGFILLEYLDRAGSSDFSTANRFARVLPELDAPLREVLTPLQALSLLVNVWDAAETGAWQARALRSQKFAGVPELRAAAISAIDGGSSEAEGLVEKIGLTLSAFKDEWLTDGADDNDGL